MAKGDAGVNTPCGPYEEMLTHWELIADLRGGTKTMRDAGEKYLPKEPGETTEAYAVRLNRSFLFPAVEKTVKGLAGQVFRKRVVLQGDVPEQITLWAENVDSTGRALSVFARDVFEAALSDGITHVHVEYPKTPEGQTLEQERSSGARPYMRHIFANQVIAWWSEPVNGVETLTEVRIREDTREKEGEWGEKTVTRIRVLRRGEWLLYEERDDNTWAVVGTGETRNMIEIPFFSIYTGRKGFMIAESPLIGLAYLNVCHWQSNSDQRNILRVARVPMLFGSGWQMPEGKQLDVGVNRAIVAKEPNATLRWVEHQGAAINAGKEDLEALKEEMAIVGLELLTRRPGNETATSRAITKAEADSALAAMGAALKDGLEIGLSLMAKWGGLGEDGGSVTVNTDFGLTEDKNLAIETLITMRTNRDISRETFLKEVMKLGVLPDDLLPDEESARIEAEEPETGEWSELSSAEGV
jgi:hypothetical protein